MSWEAALKTVQDLARILVPAQEVDDLVGRVMLELVRSTRPGESAGDDAPAIRSLPGLGCSICQKRAMDVFRELRRREVFVSLEQAADVAGDEGAELEPDTDAASQPSASRRYRGPHQKKVEAVLRAGGTLADAQTATGLCDAEFAKVIRRMVEPDHE